ncbi:MAG: NHL repeat-containing protein [Planctomycetota bacterium]
MPAVVLERRIPLHYGHSAGQVALPQALAVASVPRQHLVADGASGANKVLVIERSGDRIATFGDLRFPGGIAVNDQRVLIADTGQSRIVELDRQGSFIRSWGRGALHSPRDVALMDDGSILVADSRAQSVSRIGVQGGVTTLIGTSATDGQLGEALAVAAGPQGRIAAYFRDKGLYLIGPEEPPARIPRERFEGGSPREIEGLVFDPAGNLYAADSKQGEVLVLDAEGNLRQVLPNERRGGRLSKPVDVDFVGGRLFILDAQALAIWTFRIEG